MSNFTFTKIDVPAPVVPYAYISVNGVDGRGEAVGNYGNVDGEGDGTFHGLIATDGVGVTFDPPNSTNTDVVGVTSSGEIFGDYVDNVLKQHGFIDNNGTITQVDVFLANSTTINGVNDAGVIYGGYVDSTNALHGFIDNAGTFTMVDVPGYTAASVSGVNASGVIVGTVVDAASRVHSFVESNGSFKTIDPAGSIFTSVIGISDAGVIVGNYQNAANIQHGFVDNNGVFTTINIAGAATTSITAIAADGEIVGNYSDSGGNIHGFVDQGGVITTVDVPGATETNILGVSASGEITGYYNDGSYNQHGFVGMPGPNVIESSGSTSLVQVGANYDLDDVSSGTGPELQYQGAPVTVGQFGTDVPVGAEQTSSGYDVAFKDSATGLYTVWATDSSGNFSSFVFSNLSGTNPTLETIETTFHQDLNGDGTIGLVGTVIESSGSTSLVETNNNFWLESISGGSGPELKYHGAAVTAGEFAPYAPIAVEQTATGYDLAWKNPGSSLYTAWSTDSNGNYIANIIGDVAGNSSALEALETTFHQDLNGDGVIGLPTVVIQTDGSTALTEVGNNYFLYDAGSGPELTYHGAAVTAGQFAPYVPIGAVQTATGYDVAWKNPGANLYTAWSTDSNGNFISSIIGDVPANSSALEALETTFHQDLNGDGVIGLPTVVIQTDGSTALTEVGNNYFLYNAGTGPELKYHGAVVTAGEFAPYVLIGAVQTAIGYDVAWKYPGSNLYTAWSTDSNGNFISSIIGDVPANSSALEALETTFHQDLNGDGVIGLPTVVIQTDGSTALTEVGNNYFLYDAGAGPELKYHGAVVTAGEFAPYVPIGAVQTATGYDVAWKNPGANLYTAWSTDSNGNYISNIIGDLPANSSALESLETTFHQDLNGDGAIGIPGTIATGGTLELTVPDSMAVHFNGSTGSLILDHSSGFAGQITGFSGTGSLSSSDQIDLRDIGFGTGTTVAYTGSSSGGTLTVTDAQNHTANISLLGNYTGSTFSLSSDGSGGTIVIDPPVKQDIVNGTLSFNDPGPTDKETVTVSPHSGGAGYIGNFTVDAVTTANGQDSAGWHFNFDSNPAATTVTQSYDVTVADHHTNGTNSTATQSVTVTIAGAGNDAFVFHPGVGADTIVNATSADTFELDGFSSVTSNHQLASLLAEAQAGLSQSLFQTANGGHDTLINLGNHDVITLANVSLADLHAGNFILA